MEQPTVSVCITTYNHEKYIIQALESVLAQQTSFPIEILIGEDDSSDNTRAIVQDYCEQYQKKHPDKIRLFLHDKKDKLFINGRPTGRLNFINNIKQARGKYIALLDGDDYWSDNHKLEKQVALMESRPDCAICFHDVSIVNDRGEKTGRYHGVDERATYSLEDIVKDNFIPTASTLVRNHLIREFPDFFYKTSMADWPFHILNAQQGSIAYLPEVMAVYRMHEAGRWTAFRAEQARVIEARLQLWDFVEPRLPATLHATIDRERIKQLKKLVKAHARNKDYQQTKETLQKLVAMRGFAAQSNIGINGFLCKYSLWLAFAAVFYNKQPNV